MTATKDIYIDRAERFRELLNNKPVPGDTLCPKDKDSVRVNVQTREDRGSFVMFVNAVVDDDGTGWFLSEGSVGLKCLITPSSQQVLLDEFDMLNDLKVVGLRVVRHNQRGTALICEVLL